MPDSPTTTQPPPDVIDGPRGPPEGRPLPLRQPALAPGWSPTADGAITGCGYSGGGLMGSTTVAVGGLNHEFEAVALPLIQPRPRWATDGSGSPRPPAVAPGSRPPAGCAGARSSSGRPRWCGPPSASPSTPTGPPTFEVLGASRFPRHWFYDGDNRLAAKSGLTDFKDWYRKSFGKHTPWGDQDSPALVTAVETALERALSARMMIGPGDKPKFKKVGAGETLVQEGDERDRCLPGPRRGDPGRERTASGWPSTGPGAVLGERAGLEDGVRTSTLVAVTDVPGGGRAPRGAWTGPAPRAGPGPPPRRAAGLGGARPPARASGARYPPPDSAFARYGGNTSCVAIAHESGPTDGRRPHPGPRRRHRHPGPAGGLAGAPLRRQPPLTHLHWDHVEGLPFCTAIDRDDARCDLYLPAQADGTRRGRRASVG